MAALIAFKTSRFDPGEERPNPINPIRGESVLIWLRENAFTEPFTSTEPDAEDWGWYVEVSAGGTRYLVGASGQFEEDQEPATGELEWAIQIEKQRTMKEKLLGRNKMQGDDALVVAILDALKADAAMLDVELDSDD